MRNQLLIVIGVLAGVALILLIGIRLVPRPNHLGVKDHRLAPCPKSPNCVSSQASDRQHQLEPISIAQGMENPRIQLRQILQAQPGARIIQDTNDYLHVEFRSRLLGFCDDVEFWIDAENALIHFRSASRIGYSDLGVNRQRITTIRKAFVSLAK